MVSSWQFCGIPWSVVNKFVSTKVWLTYILNIYMILVTLWNINIQLMRLTFLNLWLQWGQLLPNLRPHIVLHTLLKCRAGLIDNVEVEPSPVPWINAGWVGVAFDVTTAAAINLVGGDRVPTPRGGTTVVYGDTGGRHCGWGASAVTVCVAVGKEMK